MKPIILILLLAGEMSGQNFTDSLGVGMPQPSDPNLVNVPLLLKKHGYDIFNKMMLEQVDRYLRECYADSEIVVRPEYQYWVDHLGVVPQREIQHFKNTGALMHYLSQTGKGNNISIEVRHLKPTFDDFKKWLRRK